MFVLNQAEQIETIVYSHLKRHNFGGKMGTIAVHPVKGWIVTTVSGEVFLVDRTSYGWEVQRHGSTMAYLHSELYEAARECVEAN